MILVIEEKKTSVPRVFASNYGFDVLQQRVGTGKTIYTLFGSYLYELRQQKLRNPRLIPTAGEINTLRPKSQIAFHIIVLRFTQRKSVKHDQKRSNLYRRLVAVYNNRFLLYLIPGRTWVDCSGVRSFRFQRDLEAVVTRQFSGVFKNYSQSIDERNSF